MIAKTFQGLEEILAEELTTLGANDVQIGLHGPRLPVTRR